MAIGSSQLLLLGFGLSVLGITDDRDRLEQEGASESTSPEVPRQEWVVR